MRPPKHPAYSVPDPYIGLLETHRGVSDGFGAPASFGVMSEPSDPIQRNLRVDSKLYMADLHAGGKYRYHPGTVTQPSIGFASDTDSGIYSPAAGQVAVTIAGTKEVDVSATLATFTHDIAWKSGTSFTATLAHNLGADRTYTFDGANGTVWTSGNDGAGSGLDADTVDGSHASAFQPVDATLTAFAALTIAADSLTIGTGADAFSQTTFAANTFPARASTGSLVAKSITDFGLSLVDDATAGDARSTLGLGSLATLSTVGTSQIDDEAVTLAKLEHFLANTILLRNAGTTGDPDDVKISALTEEASPAAGDWLLMEESGGNLRKVDVGNLPSGAAPDVTDGTTTVSAPGELQFSGQHFDVTDNGGNAAITLTHLKVVEDHTANDNLTSAESGSTHTNAGASGIITLTLPGAAAGIWYKVIVLAAQTLNVAEAGGDTIRINASTGVNAAANTIGHIIIIEAVSSSLWVAYTSGSWTLT